jgi:hypothetical protein
VVGDYRYKYAKIITPIYILQNRYVRFVMFTIHRQFVYSFNKITINQLQFTRAIYGWLWAYHTNINYHPSYYVLLGCIAAYRVIATVCPSCQCYHVFDLLLIDSVADALLFMVNKYTSSTHLCGIGCSNIISSTTMFYNMYLQVWDKWKQLQ